MESWLDQRIDRRMDRWMDGNKVG